MVRLNVNRKEKLVPGSFQKKYLKMKKILEKSGKFDRKSGNHDGHISLVNAHQILSNSDGYNCNHLVNLVISCQNVK